MLAMAGLLWVTRALPMPRWGGASQRWRLFSRGLVLVAAGQVLFAFVPLVDPLLAAPLGEGMVAALGFAGRLVIGLQGLAGLALQRSGLPLLSQLAVSSPTAVLQVAGRWAWMAATLGLVIGVVVAWWAEPLVALVFERGRFSSSDRQWVAELLRFGMLQMPPFLAGLVVVTALAGAHAHRSLAWVSTVGLVAKLVFSLILVRHQGAVGLQAATALMYVCTLGAAWVLLVRHMRQQRQADPGRGAVP
jgi:peptidoglycan biosynthesis protein MviN/MurJ (putative lipid II flippase)